MAGRPPRMRCYVYDRPLNPRNTVRLDDENIMKRQTAITRHDNLNHSPMHINNDSKLCTNCNISILDKIAIMEADPGCLRLNILTQNANRSCVICNADYDLHRLSIECTVNVFIETNIIVLEDVKSCEHHLDENGLFLNFLLPGLHFFNRPYIIKGLQLSAFLPGMFL